MDIFGRGDPFKNKMNDADNVAEDDDDEEDNQSNNQHHGLDITKMQAETENHMYTNSRMSFEKTPSVGSHDDQP